MPVPKNGKGIKKVKKQRKYMDDKGYFVTEEYSDYEEYVLDIPAKKEAAASGMKSNIKKAPATQT